MDEFRVKRIGCAGSSPGYQGVAAAVSRGPDLTSLL
jgi:hypothetical protein